MSDAVLVDRSVWIDALRPPPSACADALDDLLQQGLVLTTSLVAQEVLQGIRVPQQVARVSTLLGALPRANADWAVHLRAARLFRALRSKGLTVTTIDVALAQLAIDRGVCLWSLDSLFLEIARRTKLRIHRSPS